MPGCYTAARYEAGKIRHALRHARRLRRDARAIGLVAPPEETLLDALVAVGREAFGSGAGVVRLALRDEDEACLPVGDSRLLGDESRIWRAIRFADPHPGNASEAPGAKREGVALYARARDAAKAARVDEALLHDASGRMVEGARSNLFVLRADGALVTPALDSGAVAGVAREIVLEQLAEAQEAEIRWEELAHARELVCVNAVRGACRLTRLDGHVQSAGVAPMWSEKLHALLLSDPPPR